MALLYICFLMRLDIRNTPYSLARFVRHTILPLSELLPYVNFSIFTYISKHPDPIQSSSRANHHFAYILQSAHITSSKLHMPYIISLLPLAAWSSAEQARQVD
ncbi:hypothetical protein VTL71DRAFT_9030 [Oculimacula yallundae]|uniref:Uncharacterized protein n=1 Tax=Oculimacula yallundae TaxID=86028 RepID=A0ABR4BTN8_9HELO